MMRTLGNLLRDQENNWKDVELKITERCHLCVTLKNEVPTEYHAAAVHNILITGQCLGHTINVFQLSVSPTKNVTKLHGPKWTEKMMSRF